MPASRYLKDELPLQFDYPWRCVRSQTCAINGRRLTHCPGNLSEPCAVNICVWKGKVRMVEEIKEPCADGELCALPPRYGKCLFKVKVSIEVTWASKLIPALGSEVICWIGKICNVVTSVRQTVYQLRSRGTAVDVGRAHDIGKDRSRSGWTCAAK